MTQDIKEEIGIYGKHDNDTRYLKIGVNNSVYGDQSKSEGEIDAYDNGNDGRFDTFYMVNLSKGHPLETEFNSFESMEKAYSELRSEYSSTHAELNDTKGKIK